MLKAQDNNKLSFDFGYSINRYKMDSLSKIAIKYEYEYLNSPIIGSIGISVGYQYFVTNKLKDKYIEEWQVKNSEAINLDFSGFYYSIYIIFGK